MRKAGRHYGCRRKLEIVRDNETGFLAESATVKSFGSALERAWVAEQLMATNGT